MSKGNGELLHVFNEYLNKQEAKTFAPQTAKEEQLHEQDYKLEKNNDNAQLNANEGLLDFQVISKDEKVEGLDKKLNNIRPVKLSDAERYKKMKNIIKSVKADIIESGRLSINDLMEWAMSTAAVDGASDEFMAIIIAMKGIDEIFKKQAAAKKKLDELLAKKESGEVSDQELAQAKLENKEATLKGQASFYSLARNARKYVDNHDGVKWSDKGKSRLAFANYILSSDFMEKYVMQLSDFQLKSVTYSKNLDANTFIIAYELKENAGELQTAIHNEVFDEFGHVRERIDGFTMESTHRLPSRGFYNQVKMLSSEEGMEAEKAKVTNAMTAYIGKKVTGVDDDGEEVVQKVKVDKEPLYSLLDDVVEEVCKFKITEEHFTKEYYIKHPEELIRIRRIVHLTGDCLDEKGKVALGECGKEYLDLIKNSKGYEKFYAKLNLMTHLWFSFVDYMTVGGCLHIETMLQAVSQDRNAILENRHFDGAVRIDFDEEEYAEYTEAVERTPKEWLKLVLQESKNDKGIRQEVKKYYNSSIFSSITVPKRNKKANKKK